jgi:hypothetical protein
MTPQTKSDMRSLAGQFQEMARKEEEKAARFEADAEDLRKSAERHNDLAIAILRALKD